MSRSSWRAGFHSGGRLRAHALSAELNTIASARTLAERIACTSRSARVAWRPSQHAATAAPYATPSGRIPRSCIWSHSCSARCHCLPRVHAVIADA
eukprot:jgi/Chrpa1/20893/Chrysochromulina_OHIO_Genome00006438-RA